METTPKPYHLSDDSKSLDGNDHLRPLPAQQQILQLNEEPESVGGQGDIQVKYYLEFKKIYFTSYKLWSEILKQSKMKESLGSRLAQMEVAQRLIQNQLASLHKARRHEDIEEDIEEQELSSKRKNSKRTRRTAEEIERKYYCAADFCGRCYGSEGSLQQHIKLKHPELYRHSEDEADY